MSKGSAARRLRPTSGWGWRTATAATPRPRRWPSRSGAWSARGDGLREQVAEVEGWYRLLRAERNRLEGENRDLNALVARLSETEAEAENRRGDAHLHLEERPKMMHIMTAVRAARRHKWAAAALVAIGTLLARDPGVNRGVEAVAARARRAFDRGDDRARDAADSGFVRYAAMINARDQADRARDQYNRAEATLKGDALLEAQDRLRASKARYLQARLAFLPELARQCHEAAVPVPGELADAIDALKTEVRE